MFRIAVWMTAAVLLTVVVFVAVAGLVNQMAVASACAIAALAVAAALIRRRLDGYDAALATVPPYARHLFIAGAALLLVQILPIGAYDRPAERGKADSPASEAANHLPRWRSEAEPR